MTLGERIIQEEVKQECFACVLKGVRYGCSALKQIDCKGCKFYKNRKDFRIDIEKMKSYKKEEEI